MPSIELKLRVRWADSDPAQRINFPRYFEYMEDGETELLRQCGFSYRQLPDDYGFPRINAECTFKKILPFDAAFTMRTSVGKLGNSSIRYEYQFFNEDDELAAEGSMTVVVIRNGRPAPIPEAMRQALMD